MLDILDKLYSISSRNVIVRIYKYAVKIIANVWVYLIKVRNKEEKDVDSNTLIVSFTSYPARIQKVYLVAKTLLAQRGVDNFKVVLWLSIEQFPKGIDSLPSNLTDLCPKGLDIRFVNDDLRPHKKYFYAFKEYPNNIVITVDDDVLYPSTLIKKLYEVHCEHPKEVIYNRGAIITKKAYDTWAIVDKRDEMRDDVLPTGVGGVLYPPHCYNEKIFDVDAIKATCISTDDLWLSTMCRLNKTKSVYTGGKYGLINTVSSQKFALCNINCGGGKNDLSIRKISEWTHKHFGVDFYMQNS